MSEAAHNRAIVDQFTRQAAVFNVAPSLTKEQALRSIVAATQAGPDDTVLDVACGGGVVLCEFAPHVKHATGIDMTPAMLDFGREHAARKGLANVTFRRGDATTLPFPDGSFSVVVTRYTFHHFLEPLAVFKEMVRVCRRGGRIAVVDMYASEDNAKRRNGTGWSCCAIRATCAACR
jgi:ubiquinone/menaquinone biosynthesis C-methylase UbiE